MNQLILLGALTVVVVVMVFMIARGRSGLARHASRGSFMRELNARMEGDRRSDS